MRGFSLIEVTIAVAIIGITIVATSALFSRLPVNGREVRDQDLALKIANNEIETLRAGGYSALPSTGSFNNALLSSLVSGTGSVTITVIDAKTKRADVSVSWQGTSAARSVSLTTLLSENSGL